MKNIIMLQNPSAGLILRLAQSWTWHKYKSGNQSKQFVKSHLLQKTSKNVSEKIQGKAHAPHYQ